MFIAHFRLNVEHNTNNVMVESSHSPSPLSTVEITKHISMITSAWPGLPAWITISFACGNFPIKLLLHLMWQLYQVGQSLTRLLL